MVGLVTLHLDTPVSRPATTSGPSRSCSATADVATTMMYTRVLNRGLNAVRSPADRMFSP